ncbi:unnamed protein product [Albugo candida]|uniref:Uncharacterized protein n=1 Tax=Albugo candida TaxID=65357 RepID=A0A024GLK2_9STRA|nr:unnamed protein product [Albugo candida]|eukprot:CCI47759.1 unnamed protein product [Albugo candida]
MEAGRLRVIHAVKNHRYHRKIQGKDLPNRISASTQVRSKMLVHDGSKASSELRRKIPSYNIFFSAQKSSPI